MKKINTSDLKEFIKTEKEAISTNKDLINNLAILGASANDMASTFKSLESVMSDQKNAIENIGTSLLSLNSNLGSAESSGNTITKAFGDVISVFTSFCGAADSVLSPISNIGGALDTLKLIDGASVFAGIEKVLPNIVVGFSALLNPVSLVLLGVTAFLLILAKLVPVGEGVERVMAICVATLAGAGIISAIIPLVQGLGLAFKKQALEAGAATATTIAYNFATQAMAVASGAGMVALSILKGAFDATTVATLGSIAPITLFGVTIQGATIALMAGCAVILGLVAVIGIFAAAFFSQSDATKASGVEVDNLVEKQKNLTSAIAEQGTTYDSNKGKILAQTEITKGLKDEIESLSAIENKSAEDKALLQSKIEQLNSAIPGLTLLYDENTDSLNMSSEAIESQLEAQEAQLELNEQLAEQQKLKEQEIEIEAELIAVKEKKLEIEEELRNNGSLRYADEKALKEQLESLTESEKEYGDTLIDLEGKQKVVNEGIENNSRIVQENRDELKAQEELNKKLADSYENYAKITTNAFKEVETKQAQSIGDLTANLRNNTAVVDQWSQDLDEMIVKGFDKGFIQQLRDAGPELAATVRALVGATEEEVAEFNTAFEGGAKVAVDSAVREFSAPENAQSGKVLIENIAEEVKASDALKNAVENQIKDVKVNMQSQVSKSNFATIGHQIGNGLINGIDSKIPEVREAGKRLGQAVEDGVKIELKINSPSKKMIAVGHGTAEGLIIGSQDKEEEVKEAGSEIGKSYVEGLSTEFSAELWDAAVIMGDEWTALHEDMTDIVKMTGGDLIQAEIGNLDKIIRETEEKNADMAKLKELSNKQQAIEQATSDEERRNAQEELNDFLLKNELEANKKKRDELKQHLKEIADEYQKLNNAIVEALKAKYAEQRDLSKNKLTAEYNEQKELLEKSTDFRKEQLDKQLEYQKESTNSIIEQYTAEYEARIQSLNWSENSEISDLQSKIDAIDNLTAEEERGIKEQADAKKLNDLSLKIQQAKTAEERLEAQASYNEEVAKQQREALLQQRKEEKDSLKEQINQIKEFYKEQREAEKEDFEAKKQWAKAEEQLQLDSLKAQKEILALNYKESKEALDLHFKEESAIIENHYKTLTESSRLQAEANKMIVADDQQAIVDLLQEYTPGWETAGQSAGQAFIDGLQAKKSGIEQKVADMMSVINQANQAQDDYMARAEEVKAEINSEVKEEVSPKQNTTYTVKSGDTLSGIASKYAVTVSQLRQQNGLSAEDDRKLAIGTVLKIPILHKGGMSRREQIAVIDNKEAVAPLSELAKMMEQAVVSTTNKLVTGFSQSIRNVTNSITNNNDNGLQLTVNYQGEMSRSDVNRTSRLMAEQTAREIRSRGIASVGGLL